MSRFLCLGVAFLATGCAHRNLHIDSAELERAAPTLLARGEVEVRTSRGPTTLRASEHVQTVSGEISADKWVASNCEPGGRCHFGGQGVSVARVDSETSVTNGLAIAGVTLTAAAGGGALTCATGAICEDDSARTTGAIVLGVTGALVVVGVIALAMCDTCWSSR